MQDLNDQPNEVGCVEFEVSINEPSVSWTARIAFGPQITRRTIGLRNVTCTACSGEHNDIGIRRDYSVSGFHALLSLVSNELRITDSVASTGTFVNGHRLQRGEHSVLLPLDEVRVGQTVITITRLNRNTPEKAMQDQPARRRHEPVLV
jgi:pSer/pThr/pTyr-binding forkhead associated (FHA) protein